jgi:subtilisin family serine protease
LQKKYLFSLIILAVIIVMLTFVAASTGAKSDIYPPWILVQSPVTHTIMADQPVPYAAIYGSKVIVAVLDSGIDIKHKDLAGKVLGSVNFTESRTEFDLLGHGTSVAGIIAANNGTGIPGAVHGIDLLNVKVVNDNGSVWPSDVARGIVWAVDNGAQIINMSFTAPTDSAVLKNAVEYAAHNGVIMLAAAGNRINSKTYPAAYPNVIAVEAIASDGRPFSDNLTGGWVDIYAPGYNIYSAVPGNKYAYKSGSSFATAGASRQAALILGESCCFNDPGTCNKVSAELGALYSDTTR